MIVRDEFQKHLEQNPKDWETRLVYADWLEEVGDLILANGQRWQVEFMKHAEQVRGVKGYQWTFDSEFRAEYDLPAIMRIRIVSELLDVIEGVPKSRDYETILDAEIHLANALSKLEIISTCNHSRY